jgi:SAM-dependent methyltransferase
MSARRRVLDAARRRFPAAFERVRRASSLPRGLAAWYAQRLFGSPEAYDEEFWDFHQGGDWDGFARVLLAHAPARSVLDVGCGDAKLLAAVLRAAPGVRVLGVDGSPAALAAARARGVQTRTLDLASLGRREVEAEARAMGTFGLAISLETVEHFPPWHSGKLLRLVACAPVVAFSAARPGQGGTMHVNERPVEHWVRRFRRLGYTLSPRNAGFRAAVAELDLPSWYAANINLFVRAP